MRKSLIATILFFMSCTLLVNCFHHEVAAVWHAFSHLIKAENHHHHHHHEGVDIHLTAMDADHEHTIINQFIAQFKVKNGIADEHSTYIIEQTTYKICDHFCFQFPGIYLLDKSEYLPFLYHEEKVFIAPPLPPPNDLA